MVPDHEDHLSRGIGLLKESVELNAAFDARVMEEVRAQTAPRLWSQRIWTAVDWLTRGRSITVSPLAGVAVAAGLAIFLLVGRVWFGPDDPSPTEANGLSSVQFVIVAPSAASVSLVGDFNDWAATATPMQPVAGNGVWSVTVPLSAGRYRYAFLVNGDMWLSDPSAPPALDDEFGRPGSVLTIGEL
jgi:hypothetical protein